MQIHTIVINIIVIVSFVVMISYDDDDDDDDDNCNHNSDYCHHHHHYHYCHPSCFYYYHDYSSATASIEKDSSGQKYSKQTHKRSPDSGYATANQPKKARPDVTAARQLFSSPATSTPTPVGPAASEGQPSSTSTTPSGEKEKPAQTDVSGHTGPKKGNKKFQLFKRNVYELLSYLQPLINWSRASTTSRPLEVGSEEDVQNTVKTWLSEYKKEK